MINKLIFPIVFIFSAYSFSAQDVNNKFTVSKALTNKKGSEYKFSVVKNMDATAVQNQNMTGTCWSFSRISVYRWRGWKSYIFW